jgi:hypothetical protein
MFRLRWLRSALWVRNEGWSDGGELGQSDGAGNQGRGISSRQTTGPMGNSVRSLAARFRNPGKVIDTHRPEVQSGLPVRPRGSSLHT